MVELYSQDPQYEDAYYVWWSIAAGLSGQLQNFWQDTTLSVFVLVVCLRLQHAFLDKPYKISGWIIFPCHHAD